MARSGAKRHTHKYFRLITDGLWHCGMKNCTHYMPTNMPEPVWKDSVCWICERPFELTPDNMRADHPVCHRCPPYDTHVPEEIQESVEEYTERKLQEARMKRFTLVEPTIEEDNQIESETIHTAECSVWSSTKMNKECDCGAE